MNRITTGAYLIRNTYHYKLLHVVGDSEHDFHKVNLHGRDENVHRDRQIWWVEPEPGEEGTDVYSITNIRTGKALQRDNSVRGRGVGVGLIIEDRDIGSEKQMWEIRRVMDGKAVYYSIVNTSRCGDVALDTGAAHNGWPLETWYPKDHKSSQLWEFIVPVVAIPAGWTQIRNLATGHVLSHTGLGDRPVAVIPPSPSSRYQYSEGWSLQWQFSARLSRADTNNCKDLETVEWIIENRLTGAILCREALHDLSSATMKESYDRELCSSGWTCLNGLWHPEVSLGGHWIIRSRKGGALEEIQTEAKNENDLAVDSNSTEDSRLRNWVFLPLHRLTCNEDLDVENEGDGSLEFEINSDTSSGGPPTPSTTTASLADYGEYRA